MTAGIFGGVFGDGIIGAPATGLTVPAYAVQVSFTDPFDTPDYVDITRWCRGGSTKRGRQHELQRCVAGSCSLKLTNQDGRFSTFNTTGPFVNQMTGVDSYFVDLAAGATPGTWTATGATPAVVANQGFDGLNALSLTATGTTTITAQTASGTSGYPVTANATYGFMVSFKTAATSRSTCAVGVTWYTAAGASISTATGNAVTDVTTGYTKATLTSAAPGTAAFAAIVVSVTGPVVLNEVHYITRVLISSADSHGYVTPGWAPGGRGLVPARPVQVSGTWGNVTYPAFTGYVDSWVPAYGAMASDQVINATDGMNLLSLSYITTSGYKGQVLADGAVGYWPFSDADGSTSIADNVATNTISDPINGGQRAVTFGAASLIPSDTSNSGTLVCVNQVLGTGGTLQTFPSGTSGYVSATNGFTIEAVVSTSATFSGGYLFGVGNAAFFNSFVGSGNGVYIDASGHVGGIINSATIGVLSAVMTDGKAHHVAFTWSGTGTAAVYVDGVLAGSVGALATPGATSWIPFVNPFQGTTTTGNVGIADMSVTNTVLSAGQIAVHSAMSKTGFVQQQSGQRIAAILNVYGVPASLQSIATGISAVQAPTASLSTTQAVSYIQTVENTEQGFFFVNESGVFTYYDRHYIIQNVNATASNAVFVSDNDPTHYHYVQGSLVPADDALDLWNDAPVSAIANAPLGVTGTLQDATNVDSQRWYRRRTLQGYVSMLQTSDTEALSLSQWLVAHYSTPIARVRQMTLSSAGINPSNIGQMLGRKLLDRITVQWQPLDGTSSPFAEDSLIESIAHTFGPDVWTTTWGLSVAETQGYLTLNDPVRGTLAATGATTGNRLGY